MGHFGGSGLIRAGCFGGAPMVPPHLVGRFFCWRASIRAVHERAGANTWAGSGICMACGCDRGDVSFAAGSLVRFSRMVRCLVESRCCAPRPRGWLLVAGATRCAAPGGACSGSRGACVGAGPGTTLRLQLIGRPYFRGFPMRVCRLRPRMHRARVDSCCTSARAPRCGGSVAAGSSGRRGPSMRL